MQDSLTLLISTAVVPVVVQLLKKWKAVSFLNQGQTGRLRVVVAVLSFAAVLGGQFLTGSFDDTLVKESAESLSMALVTFFSATGAYKLTK